jgi:acetyltransferase-like isoleucine patch superfamily enzyme
MLRKPQKYFKHKTAIVGPRAKIGEGTRVWAFVNIQDGVRIGQGCNICDGCFIEKGVVIGNNVTIKNGVAIFEGVTIEDDVFCGVHAVFINDRRPRSFNKETWALERTVVKKGATLGSNTTILCGITIGEYAMIGAGSVVVKDVPAYALMTGNPARRRGYACRCGLKLDRGLRCSCGLSYRMKKGGLTHSATSPNACHGGPRAVPPKAGEDFKEGLVALSVNSEYTRTNK